MNHQPYLDAERASVERHQGFVYALEPPQQIGASTAILLAAAIPYREGAAALAAIGRFALGAAALAAIGRLALGAHYTMPVRGTATSAPADVGAAVPETALVALAQVQAKEAASADVAVAKTSAERTLDAMVPGLYAPVPVLPTDKAVVPMAAWAPLLLGELAQAVVPVVLPATFGACRTAMAAAVAAISAAHPFDIAAGAAATNFADDTYCCATAAPFANPAGEVGNAIAA